MITAAQFKKIFPHCPQNKVALYLPLLIAAMREFAITSRRRAASFLAQLGHESCDFKYFEELASGKAYEGRRDLGNTQPGDGVRFKGRGPIQITGRMNYSRVALALSIPCVQRPEMLARPDFGYRAAAWFWQTNHLNSVADMLSGSGSTSDIKQFDQITHRVNGGYNGRDDRRRRYLVALSVLTDEQFAAPAGDVEQKAASVVTQHDSQAVSVQETQPDGTQAQTAAITAQTSETSDSSSLLDSIQITDETRTVGGSILKRLGLKVGASLAALWGMGLHGKLILLLASVVIFFVLYHERTAIKQKLMPLVGKLSGK